MLGKFISIIYPIFLWKILTILILAEAKDYYLHPDTGLNISQILERHGYPFESHVVQTEDGYILALHRIPHGRQNDNTDTQKPVVLLVHGMGSQSTDFVNMDDRSLGFILADQGYDVWMLNTRGNTHSRKHIKYNPDKHKKKFWNFSWHELGIHDVPNTIDYILESTKQESLFYIGHSQGTTAFFVMTSMLPEYNKKIKLMSAMGPSTFSAHLSSNIKFRALVDTRRELEALALITGVHEMFPHSPLYLDLIKEFCLNGMETYGLCLEIYYTFVGYSEEFNMTMLPVILSNSPSGFSVKQGFHYLQGASNGGHWRQYDYGRIENLFKYGQAHPPDYDLSNVVCPVTLHYSLEDQCVNYRDVETMGEHIPNAMLRRVPSKHFTHIDFLFGNNVKTLIYDYILDDMKKYL